MFWKKKIPEVIQIGEHNEITELKPTPQPRTIDVFKEYIDSQNLLKYPDHYIKIHEFMNDEEYQMIFTPEEKRKIIDIGFTVFIKAEWIKRFKYHASVWKGKEILPGVQTHYESDDPGRYYSLGDEVQYKGDIPESVIEKAKLIQKTGLIHQITIHSMFPLPMEFVKIDPILIGWTYCPEISVDENGMTYSVYSPKAEGVIIAVWDYDKEFNI